MKLSSAIRAARLVAAPRERIWRVFSELAAGPCELPGGLQASQGIPSHPGERFPLHLRRWLLTPRGQAVLAAWSPGELAAWRGRLWGLPFNQALIFTSQGDHCLVESHLTVTGWSLIPARLLLPAGDAARAAARWLRELAHNAEGPDQDRG